MSALDAIAECRERGIELVACGPLLRYRPIAAVPPELRQRLADLKPEILAHLRGEDLPRAEFGCWSCGSREFARDLADRDWVCVQCHPVEEYRAHLPRCTSRYPSRRGGAS